MTLPKGGLVQAFPAVQLHRQIVFLFPAQMPGEVHRKGGIAAAVAGQQLPVEVYPGAVGCSLKHHPHPPALPAFRGREKAQIAADHLVILFAEIVEGQQPHRVGQPHRLKLALRLFQLGQTRIKPRGEIPAVVQRIPFHCLSSFCQDTFHQKIHHAVQGLHITDAFPL